MNNQDPQFTGQPIPPHLRDDNVVSDSPLNPNHPSSQAYVKKSHKVRTALIIVGVLFVGLVGCTALVGGVLSDSSEAPVSVTAGSPPATSEPTEDTADPTPAPTKAKPTKTAPKLTASQEQAIGSAENYLDYTAFSRKGLIRQLSSFEGFSVADATYAVDHIKVDWNEQAAKSAKTYLELTHFSRKGLLQQLESFEGFTPRQAAYGVSKAGLR